MVEKNLFRKDLYARISTTLTFIEPLAVLKGRLSGPLVVHQVGGMLPDGRYLKIWGAPEYLPGHEVIVFAIRRAAGEYQTAELLLGKFEVQEDVEGARFAVPDLQIDSRRGVTVLPVLATTRTRAMAVPAGRESLDSESAPRSLAPFLAQVRTGHFGGAGLARPKGALKAVVHESRAGKSALWANWSSGTNFRWSNNATAQWTTVNTANITGGGAAEALAALAAWTNDPNSNINYTLGPPSSTNTIDLNATSVCGTSGCLSGAGVIGCGGPGGGGTHTWRGDSYITISSGFVQLRSYCSANLYDSITTQAVIEHELGHTLGFGHSDQGTSPHSNCPGDEDAAIMRSVVQHRVSLGTDDQDAIRWTYGDGLSSCTATPPPPAPTGLTPSFGTTAGGTVVTVVGTGFQSGATVTFAGIAATGVAVSSGTALTATAPAHAAGTVDVVVRNSDAQSGTLPGSFTYSAGTGFFTVTPCRLFDTRNPTGPRGGPALVANADRAFVVAGLCGIPASARQISVNLTVTQGSAAGDVRVYATGGVTPSTSSVNFRAGQTRANNVLAAVGSGGSISLHSDQGIGGVHVIVDVNGYFQ